MCRAVHHRLSQVSLLLVSLLCGFPTAIGKDRPPIRDIYVILLVLDGCRADHFAAALAAGELPTIHSAFVDQGAHFRFALATLPSATPMGYQAMVSGLFASHAGIPYLEWFDRAGQHVVPFLSISGPRHVSESFRNVYNPDASRSLHDDLAGYPTAAVYSLFARGASIQRPKAFPLRVLWPTLVSHRFEILDRLASRALLSLFSQVPERIPRFTQAGFLSTDSLGHHFGAFSQRVRDNFRQFDRFMNQFLQLLAQRHLLEKSYIIITGDHGMHDVDAAFDLPQFLSEHGLSPRPHGQARQPYDVYVGVRGISSAILSFPGPEGWATRPTLAWLRHFPRRDGTPLDIVELLRHVPQLALVAVRGDANHIHLYQADTEATITIRQTAAGYQYAYTASRTGWDPLAFGNDPQLRPYRRGQFLSAARWFALSKGSDYPDAVVQLGQLLSDGRAGDLVVISHPRWGFYHEKVATHGSHTAADMRVPLLIRGPDIAPGGYDVARIVDLYPTMRRWFGLGPPLTRIDGRTLSLQTRSPRGGTY